MKSARSLFVCLALGAVAVGLIIFTKDNYWPYEPHKAVSQPLAVSIATSPVAATGTSSSSSPSSPAASNIHPPDWNVDDFDYTFLQNTDGFFPNSLPVYRFAFVTDESGTKSTVDKAEATALASELGISGQLTLTFYENDLARKNPQWFVGNGSPDELPYWEQEPVAESSGPALDIDALSGDFNYESGQTCGSDKTVPLSSAGAIAQAFIKNRGIDLGAATATVSVDPVIVPGHPRCYFVTFTNVLPFDDIGFTKLLVPDGSEGIGGVEPPLTYVGDAGFSVVIDPATGNVVAIASKYLRLNLQSVSPIKTIHDIEAEFPRNGATIPSDSNPPFDPSLLFPRDRSGKISAVVEKIYPLYRPITEEANTSRIMGALFAPFYYGLARIPGVRFSAASDSPVIDFDILIQFPAFKTSLSP